MKHSTYNITFDLCVDGGALIIPLTADVEVHHSDVYFIVGNFKRFAHQQQSVLPAVEIKKVKGKWVHRDSEKETDLSVAIGKAIDKYYEVK